MICNLRQAPQKVASWKGDGVASGPHGAAAMSPARGPHGSAAFGGTIGEGWNKEEVPAVSIGGVKGREGEDWGPHEAAALGGTIGEGEDKEEVPAATIDGVAG